VPGLGPDSNLSQKRIQNYVGLVRKNSEGQNLAIDLSAFDELFPSHKQVFPSRSGTRSTKSLLLLGEVQGGKTYRANLEKAGSELTVRAIRLHRRLHPDLKLPRRQAIFDCSVLLVHSLSHVVSNPLRFEYLSISLNRNDYLREGQFKELNYDGLRLLLWAFTRVREQLGSEVELSVTQYAGTLDRAGTAPIGMRTRLAPHKNLKDWLCVRSLVMFGHPYWRGKSSIKTIK
jgi:hypothetical protein